MTHINAFAVLGASRIIRELNRPLGVPKHRDWNTEFLPLRLHEFQHRLHEKRILHYVARRYVLYPRRRESYIFLRTREESNHSPTEKSRPSRH